MSKEDKIILSKKELVKKRGNVIRLFPFGKKETTNIGLRTPWKKQINTKKYCYIKDRDSKKVYKLLTGDTFITEFRKLNIHKDLNISYKEAKLLYLNQDKPKFVKVTKKIIKIKAPEATLYETEFKKGKGRVLTSEGQKQKLNSYHTTLVKTRGTDKKIRKPEIILLTETTTLDYNIVEHEKVSITPPKPNIQKQTLRLEAKALKEKYKNHKNMLKAHLKKRK